MGAMQAFWVEKWGDLFLSRCRRRRGKGGKGGKILCDTGNRKKGGETRQVSVGGAFLGWGRENPFSGAEEEGRSLFILCSRERGRIFALSHILEKRNSCPFFYFPICSPRPLSIRYFPEFNRHSSHYMDSTVVGACMCSRNPRNHHATATMT